MIAQSPDPGLRSLGLQSGEYVTVDEVFLRNDELYAKAIDEDGDEVEFMLYPIGENEFGRKGGMLKLTFSDDCVAYDDLTCKKL